MKKGSVTFRQRAGKLDWKLISCIKIDDISLHSDIHELQRTLDTITFSEINSDEIRNNSADNLLKLIKLYQLIIEYLLHCQDSQIIILKESAKQNNELKNNNSKLKRSLAVMKEDVKIYQRQLTVLKNSLSKAQSGNEFQNPIAPKLISYEEEPKPITKESPHRDELIQSILNHEKETRSYMADMIDDQRRMFLEEMRMVMNTLQTQFKSPNPPASSMPSDVMITLLQNNMEQMIKNAVNNMENNLKSNQSMKAIPPPSSSSELQSLLKLSALENLQDELNSKEKELKSLERELMHREQSLVTSKQPNLPEKNNEYQMKAIKFAFKVICRNLQKGLSKKKMIAFRNLYAIMIKGRESDQLKEQGRLLSYAQMKYDNREKELQTIINQKTNAVIELEQNVRNLQAALDGLKKSNNDPTVSSIKKSDSSTNRMNVLSEPLRLKPSIEVREPTMLAADPPKVTSDPSKISTDPPKAATDPLTASEDGKNENELNQIKLLQTELQSERDKSLLLRVRYKTLLANSTKERENYEEKIKLLNEEQLNRSRNSQDNAQYFVRNSKSPERVHKVTLNGIPDEHRYLLREDISHDQLVQISQRRIAEKKLILELDADAKLSLVKEITSRIAQ